MNKLIISIFFLALAVPVLAQEAKPTDYTMLAPIPQLATEGEKTNAVTYVTGLFKLAIGLAGALAVVMIIYAGIKYMSTDAFSGKEEAKGVIENALWGLGLAIAAWLILYTINPKLVEIKFDIAPQQIDTTTTTLGGDLPGGGWGGGGGILPGYPLSPEQVAENTQIRDKLKNNKPYPVLVNNDPCATGGTIGCTNVVGLPDSALTSAKILANACKCTITITGGTEGGHSNHGPGRAAFDLSPIGALNTFLSKTNPQAAFPSNGAKVRIGTTVYTFETAGANGRATANHWHVEL